MSIDYNKLSNKELAEVFLKMDIKMVAHVSGSLTPERAAYVVSSLESKAPHCKETSHRICAVFLGLTTKEQVVAVGRVMNTKFTMSLIQELIKKDQSHLWKISSLLIGLTQRVFNKILTTASDKEMAVLQHEAMKEPLQHHLTVYVHEADQELNERIDNLLQIQSALTNVDLENFSYQDLRELLDHVEDHSAKLDHFLAKLNRALGVAWNTNRPDLIDRLNKINDTCHRAKEITIGTPRSKTSLPTGIYQTFEEALCQAFQNTNPNETLQDDELGVDALGALSLWYVKDYWNMGLLPSISKEELLKLDPETHSDKECQDYRAKLMEEVNQNLEGLGLSTVGDFKSAFLGTPNLLKGYVERRSASLTTETS